MFSYTKRKDGRLMKKVTRNGKTKYLYSNNVKDLEKQYIEFLSLNNKGVVINDENIIVKNWAEEWLTTYKINTEQATYNMYNSAINLYIIPELGYIKLKNLKEQHIMKMFNLLENKERQRDIVLLTLKQMLDKAVDNNYIYKNVAKNIKFKKNKPQEKKAIDNETIHIIRNLEQSNNNYFLILFMLYTGLRKSEVVPLQFKDIDLNQRIITINKAVHFEHNKPVIKPTKNTETRIIPILDILYNNLYNLSLGKDSNDLIFPQQNGKIRSETSMKRALETTLNAINKISNKNIKFTFHQLRHTFACTLYKANVKLKDAQYLMGHKDVKILLNIYTHLDNEDKSKTINQLNSFINS